ncbi:MAG TPA: PLP-dependent aspartate aminotransferase family protein [Bacteroidota bacterium]|nr:PLP-dependent aspartate aminotransferase family protein [Bacteroidota bacterium]
MKNSKFSTKAIHAGQSPDPATGAVMTPVFLTSTYVQQGIGQNKGYEYSRVSNPTRDALEKNIAALENGRHGMAFGSGMAAIDSIFRLLKPGDHVIVSHNVYGGTHRIGRMVWEGFGLNFSFVDTTDIKNIDAARTDRTRMIFVETPTNPTMEITDLRAVGKIAHEHRIVSVCDNTFATPYLQRPLEHGIDVVVHSLTKYLNGHSDMLGGIVVTNVARVAERLRFFQKAVGGILSPFDAWLCLRGTKTLPVRMERHGKSAMLVAKWLIRQKKIRHVHYPGLPAHPQHRLALHQMKNYGGMISFDLGTLSAAKAFLRRVKLCALAESLGGVETLISHPATMTHASIPAAERKASGITDGLVRISVGLEDVEDIISDLKQAIR